MGTGATHGDHVIFYEKENASFHGFHDVIPNFLSRNILCGDGYVGMSFRTLCEDGFDSRFGGVKVGVVMSSPS